MGVRLIVEVLDHWQDAGLTAGERDDLVVLAENANDKTRLTWGPVHAPYILKRANKSASGWKNAVGKLARKKVLEQHTPGRIKQVAVYRLTELCPDPPHDGWQGHCTRPERVTSQVTHPDKEGHLTGDPMGNPTGDPLDQEGHLTDAERVTSQVTPTPPIPSPTTPSNTPSSSVAEVSYLPVRARDSEGGGGDLPSSERSRTFVDALDYRGKPPGRKQRDKLAALVAAALEAGWNEGDLKAYLDLGDAVIAYPAGVYAHRLDENELPSPQAFSSQPQMSLTGTDARVAGWLNLPTSRGGYQPYRNPEDQNAYYEDL